MSISKRNLQYLLGFVLVLLCSLFLLSCDGSTSGKSRSDLTSDIPSDSNERDNPGQPRDNTPQVLVPQQPGTQVAGDTGSVILDYSNAAEGYICAQSYLKAKVKVLVNAPDGNEYQYTIHSAGYYITIPLSRGNGTYKVGVYENYQGNLYTALFSASVGVELSNEFGPFLYSNPYVDFKAGDQAVTLSQQLAENSTSDLEALEQIYVYVVKTIDYDYGKAATVAPGYLPKNSDTLRTDTGICFDFASLTASMLRAQRLPTKLDVGYCGSAYHAWIEVYTKEAGWVRKSIEFPGSAYVRMDPTFDSAGGGSSSASSVIGDGKNYSPIFFY